METGWRCCRRIAARFCLHPWAVKLATGRLPPFPVYPWTPLGNTSVIRGAVRNATVVAEQAVQLLMIPAEIYLNHWHATYTREEFSLRGWRRFMPGMAGQASV